MKESTQHSPQEALDLLLFEYLEGGLSEHDRKALEQRLATNPDLRDELENWKETFISQDFYPTNQLEERLITLNQVPEKISVSLSLNTIFLIVMTAFLSFMLKTDESKSFLEMSGAQKSPSAIVINTASNEKEEVNKIKASKDHLPAKPSLKESEQLKLTKAAKKDEKKAGSFKETFHIMNISNTNNISLPQAERHPVNPLEIVITKVTPATGIKALKVAQQKAPQVISRKQQRIIERKKERARQERQAREFMKGNVPYVVPLNSKNF